MISRNLILLSTIVGFVSAGCAREDKSGFMPNEYNVEGMETITETLDTCKELCMDNAKCVGFSWNFATQGATKSPCYFKSLLDTSKFLKQATDEGIRADGWGSIDIRACRDPCKDFKKKQCKRNKERCLTVGKKKCVSKATATAADKNFLCKKGKSKDKKCKKMNKKFGFCAMVDGKCAAV